MFTKSLIIFLFSIFCTVKVFAQDDLIVIPQINQETLIQAQELIKKSDKIAESEEYKNHQNWIAKNNQEFFAKQSQNLPAIDYNITEAQLQNDAVAKLLNNYRFKADDIKKIQISHVPLMIFVSSSIPKSSLKDLMIQAKKSGGVLVFRGVIGSLKNTAKFLGDLSQNDVQAIIDPRLFKLFKVEVVPTIIVLKEANQDCSINGCEITPIHDRISGNITLDYALETIANGKSSASEVALQFLNKIRAGGKNEKI